MGADEKLQSADGKPIYPPKTTLTFELASTEAARALITTLFVLTPACSSAKPQDAAAKVNFEYWSNAPGNTCARMGGKDYCFPDKDIDVKNPLSDPSPGFAILAPIEDAELANCQRPSWMLESEPRPILRIFFGDRFAMQDGKVFDTTEKYFNRLHKSLVEDDDFGDWIKPKSYGQFYGFNCIKYREGSLVDYEMLCHGGVYGSASDPPFFFTCNREGSVPSPGCQYRLFLDGLDVNSHLRRTCAPYHQKIRDLVIRYIRRHAVKGTR